MGRHGGTGKPFIILDLSLHRLSSSIATPRHSLSFMVSFGLASAGSEFLCLSSFIFSFHHLHSLTLLCRWSFILFHSSSQPVFRPLLFGGCSVSFLIFPFPSLRSHSHSSSLSRLSIVPRLALSFSLILCRSSSTLSISFGALCLFRQTIWSVGKRLSLRPPIMSLVSPLDNMKDNER